MLLNELNKIIKRPVSLVINWSLVVWLEKSDGWETGDWHHWVLVFSGIHLGNDDVWIALEFLGQLVVNWLEFLAVTAPWGISLEKDKLVSSQDEGLEGLSDDDFDWLVVAGWNWSRFVVDLKFVVLEVLEGLNESLFGNVTDDELIESSVVELDVSGSWSSLNSNVISESLSESLRDLGETEDESFSIVDVFLGEFLEGSGIIRVEVVIKEEQGLSLFTEDSVGSLLVELTNNWVSVGLDELLDGISGDTLGQVESFDSVIERSVHDETEVSIEFNFGVGLAVGEGTVD